MTKSKHQKSVLVVCDEVSEFKVLSSLLEKFDFHVLKAPGKEATSVDGLAERGETIDLAILDVDSAGTNRSAILRSLHQSYPGVRLVLMSNEAENNGAEVGPAGHVLGHVHKPTRKAQLLGTILTVMDAPAMPAA
ncbi:MAG: response regulator [Bryobacteraceae bacterium]